jgi:hypothetical protein
MIRGTENNLYLIYSTENILYLIYSTYSYICIIGKVRSQDTLAIVLSRRLGNCTLKASKLYFGSCISAAP